MALTFSQAVFFLCQDDYLLSSSFEIVYLSHILYLLSNSTRVHKLPLGEMIPVISKNL